MAPSNDRDMGGELRGVEGSLVDHHSREPDKAEPTAEAKPKNSEVEQNTKRRMKTITKLNTHHTENSKLRAKIEVDL